MHKKINIHSKIKKYEVFFDKNFEKTINKSYAENDIILIDKTVFKYISNKKLFKKKKIIKISVSENTKDYNYISKIINALLKINFTKKNKLIVIGGGITQDVSSFISHILFRGVEWIYIPTTLLSQADSCIGSKISINFENYKNLIGNYNPPNKVYINTNFLKTLDKRDILSGVGEMLHYFIISSKNDFIYFKKNFDSLINFNSNTIEAFINKCLKIKKKYIEKDEFEKNIRIFLNYGHTIGHAIESYFNYKIPHGISVCHGISFVNYVSYKRKILSKKNFDEIKKITDVITNDYKINKINSEKLYKIILKDKKNLNGIIRLILIQNYGKPLIKKIYKKDTLINYLNDYFNN